MTTKSSLIAGLILLNTLVYSQKPEKQERSAEIIDRGISLHDEGKYEEAMKEFKKVERNDSNYYLAGAEILNSLLAAEKNEEGLALCDHLLKLRNSYTPNILVFKGDFLDNLKKKEEAIKTFEEGSKAYPLNHSFYYEQAVVALRHSEYSKAYQLLLSSIKVNPLHASSHYQMGWMAYRANNITAAMLAFHFFLICEPQSKRAEGCVVDIEKISKSELQIDTVVKMAEFQNQNDFSEIESVLRSKVALDKKFKSKTELPYDLTKQFQLLVENIGKYQDVKGFYNEFYGKFFTAAQKQGYFEPMAYNVLSGLELAPVKKWRDKNMDKIENFNSWAYTFICKELASFPEDFNGKKITVPHWYKNSAISSAGARSADGNNEGPWNYYYKNGILMSAGLYNNGQRDKLWKFYAKDGTITEEVMYKNGEELTYTSYYSNSNPKLQLNLEKGKVIGIKKTFYSNGNPAATTNYLNGVINGPETHYYANGALRYTIENKNDILSGKLIEYFDNGKVKQKATFVNSNREGRSQNFYNNDASTLSSEGDYLKNNKIGEWKEYYRSGKIYKIVHYNNDGELNGVTEEYYENGKLNSSEPMSNGKINGVNSYYNEDGSLWQEFVYKKGKLLQYRAFKKNGEKICDSKINGKNFAVVLYHPNGVKRREGSVSDGELEGVWKDYNLYGIKITESNYKEGLLEGNQTEYYNNGKIKKERLYVKGEENGYRQSYFIHGTKESEGMIENGEYAGTWKFYYKDGTLKSKIFYVESEEEGWSEYYSVNGKLWTENLYKDFCLTKIIFHDTDGTVLQNIDLPGGNGIVEKKTKSGATLFYKNYVKNHPDGPTKSFYPNGKVETETQNEKGKRHGRSVYYSPLGQLLNDVTYFSGEKSGVEKSYSESGALETEYNYVSGEYDGLSKTYYINGKIRRLITYDWGTAEGESDMFDDAGELMCKRYFHNDLLESFSYKNAKGELLPPNALKTGESKLLCYYPNGKKSFECAYVNGDLNGKRSLYHSSGKLIEETSYYYDYTNGESKEYYPSGAVMQTETHFYGSLEGKSIGYYENGKVFWEKNYHNGAQHGWTKYYDKNGKLLKELYYFDGEALTLK